MCSVFLGSKALEVPASVARQLSLREGQTITPADWVTIVKLVSAEGAHFHARAVPTDKGKNGLKSRPVQHGAGREYRMRCG